MRSGAEAQKKVGVGAVAVPEIVIPKKRGKRSTLAVPVSSGLGPGPRLAERTSLYRSVSNVYKVTNGESLCLSAHCKGQSCRDWVGKSQCHLPLVMYSAQNGALIENLFKSFNAKLRHCPVDVWRKRAQALYNRHNEYAHLQDPCKWPPLSFGPHHPCLYDTVQVDEPDGIKRYRSIKLPIPQELIPQVVGMANKLRELKENKDMAKKVKPFLTGDPSWVNNIKVEPITDPRHPAYSPSVTQYRAVATQRIPKGALVGPPVYAGVFRQTNETDALELNSDGTMANRWAYSFGVGLFGSGDTAEEGEDEGRARLHFDAIKLSLVGDTEGPVDRVVSETETIGSETVGSETIGSRPQSRAGRRNRGAPVEIDGINTRHRKTEIERVSDDMVNWDVEAAQFRNELAMVNDPKGFGEVLGFSKQQELDGNAETLIWSLFNIPCIAYKAKRTIGVGEEILIEYGYHYWHRQQLMAWCKSENTYVRAQQSQANARYQELEEQLFSLRKQRQEDERVKIHLESLVREARSKGEEYDKYSEMLKTTEAKLCKKLNELEELETDLKRMELAKLCIQQKNLQLERKIIDVERTCNRTAETLQTIQEQSLIKTMVETAGNSVTTKTVKYCLYSELAQDLGYGSKHILSDNPETHYSNCKFYKEPLIRSQVTICDRCGTRYRLGPYSKDQHDTVCMTIIESNKRLHQKKLDLTKQYDSSAISGIQNVLGKMLLPDLTKFEEYSHHGMLKSILDLVTWDSRLSSILRMVIISVTDGFNQAIKETSYQRPKVDTGGDDTGGDDTGGDDTGGDDILITRLLLREYPMLNESYEQGNSLRAVLMSLVNNYELCRIVCSDHFKHFLLPSWPLELDWLYQIAKTLFGYFTDFPNLAKEHVTLSYINDLRLCLKQLDCKLNTLPFCKFLHAGPEKLGLKLNIQYTCTDLTTVVHEYYSQFKWPSRPLLKLPDPSIARQICNQIVSGSLRSQQPGTKGHPVKLEDSSASEMASESVSEPAHQNKRSLSIVENEMDNMERGKKLRFIHPAADPITLKEEDGIFVDQLNQQILTDERDNVSSTVSMPGSTTSNYGASNNGASNNGASNNGASNNGASNNGISTSVILSLTSGTSDAASYVQVLNTLMPVMSLYWGTGAVPERPCGQCVISDEVDLDNGFRVVREEAPELRRLLPGAEVGVEDAVKPSVSMFKFRTIAERPLADSQDGMVGGSNVKDSVQGQAVGQRETMVRLGCGLGLPLYRTWAVDLLLNVFSAEPTMEPKMDRPGDGPRRYKHLIPLVGAHFSHGSGTRHQGNGNSSFPLLSLLCHWEKKKLKYCNWALPGLDQAPERREGGRDGGRGGLIVLEPKFHVDRRIASPGGDIELLDGLVKLHLLHVPSHGLILVKESGTVDPGIGTVDPGIGTVDPGIGTVDPGTGTVDPGTGTVDPGTGTVDPGTGTVDPQSVGIKREGNDSSSVICADTSGRRRTCVIYKPFASLDGAHLNESLNIDTIGFCVPLPQDERDENGVLIKFGQTRQSKLCLVRADISLQNNTSL